MLPLDSVYGQNFNSRSSGSLTSMWNYHSWLLLWADVLCFLLFVTFFFCLGSFKRMPFVWFWNSSFSNLYYIPSCCQWTWYLTRCNSRSRGSLTCTYSYHSWLLLWAVVFCFLLLVAFVAWLQKGFLFFYFCILSPYSWILFLFWKIIKLSKSIWPADLELISGNL